MSIYCHEDGSRLFVANQVFCATTEEAKLYSALCHAHIDRIPEEERFPERIEGGLDIHFMFARRNGYTSDFYADTLSLHSMQFGDYRFSVRGKIAKLLLPNCFDTYLD